VLKKGGQDLTDDDKKNIELKDERALLTIKGIQGIDPTQYDLTYSSLGGV